MNKITLTDPLVNWLANGERGISSNTMFTFITGVNAAYDDYHSHPHDLGDFRRCRLLAEASNDIMNHLDRMKSVSREWSAIVDHWDELCRLMDEERPNWRKNENAPSPKTYALLNSLT